MSSELYLYLPESVRRFMLRNRDFQIPSAIDQTIPTELITIRAELRAEAERSHKAY